MMTGKSPNDCAAISPRTLTCEMDGESLYKAAHVSHRAKDVLNNMVHLRNCDVRV